jgi:hypothetical protein
MARCPGAQIRILIRHTGPLRELMFPHQTYRVDVHSTVPPSDIMVPTNGVSAKNMAAQKWFQTSGKSFGLCRYDGCDGILSTGVLRMLNAWRKCSLGTVSSTLPGLYCILMFMQRRCSKCPRKFKTRKGSTHASDSIPTLCGSLVAQF